jgi:Holliday junction resolvase-like predicted endonuclease
MKPIKNTSRKGDFAEYYAVTWLWDNGYEVFQNSGCSGPVDLIALKDNKTVLIDVKTLYARGGRKTNWEEGTNLAPSHKRTKKQIKMGVQLLTFNPHTRALKFVEHTK